MSATQDALSSSRSSADNVMGELEYAEHLSQKIRMLVPGSNSAASPESIYLREQALRTMGDLQSHMDSTRSLSRNFLELDMHFPYTCIVASAPRH